MKVGQEAKKQIRRLFLRSLRLAARPSLHYRASSPDVSHVPKKLLLIRPDHLGDVLLTTPALSLLREALPETEITALVGSWGAASLQNNPDVDKVLRCDFPGFSREPNANFFAPYLYALEQSRQLRQQNYDAAIIFRYDHWWGALLAYLADIPMRVGYNWPESRSFLTHSLSLQTEKLPGLPYNFGPLPQHSSAMALSLAQFALQQHHISQQLNEQITRLKFYPLQDDLRYINLHLSEWGINRGDKVIAIHPGSGATIKLWTVEGFAAVADGLAQRYGAKVIFTGGEGEKVLINNIFKLCKTKPLRWEAGGWGKLAALYTRCDLVIGLDSGPPHLAVAVGTPSIHIFGPTDPTIFGPWGDAKRHRVIRTELDLPCCPCGVLDFDRACWRGGYCLRTIKVGQVLEVAEEMLESQDK